MTGKFPPASATVRRDDFYLRLLDSFPAMIWRSRPDGACDYVNRAWCTFTDMTFEDSVGAGWLESVHPDDRERCVRTYLDAFYAREPLVKELRVRHHSGDWRWATDYGTPFEDAAGEFAGYIGAIYEITDPARLRELNEQLGQPQLSAADRTILEQLAQMASVALDSARVYDQARQQAAQLRGLASASLRINSRLSVQEILDELTRSAVGLIGAHQGITSLKAEQDGSWAATSVHLSDRYADWPSHEITANGNGMAAMVCRRNHAVRLTQRQVETHPTIETAGREHRHLPPLRGWLAAPLVSSDGDNLGLIELSDRFDGEFTDTDETVLVQLAQTASAAIEKARLYQLTAAQEAARFRDELMAGVSHDMQTPLAAIVGFADLLLEQPELPLQERLPIYQALGRQSHNLRSLVQQFLDFSRLEADRPLLIAPRPAHVVPVVDRVVELFVHQREIVVGAAQDLPRALVDPDRLEQVLANLLSNAIKFSDRPVRIVARHRGKVIIDVIDEGRGMEPDELHHAFEKFYRGANASDTSGTGLGLFISRAIVEAHGGEVTAASSPGRGSRFRITIPRAPGT